MKLKGENLWKLFSTEVNELKCLIYTVFLFLMQPSGNQFGAVDGGDAANGENQSCERSVTPLLQEFMDPSVCYVPNGYSSYYYGGKLVKILLHQGWIFWRRSVIGFFEYLNFL